MKRTGRQYHEWTTADEAKLREMWLAGHQVYDIARALGTTANSVAARRKILKLPKRSPSGNKAFRAGIT